MKVKHEGRVYWRDGERWVWECTMMGRSAPLTESDPNLVSLLNAKAAVANVAREEFGKTLRCMLWCAVCVALAWSASEITNHFARLSAAESRPR